MTPIAQPERRRLQPYAWNELGKLPQRKPLIKGLMDCSTLSLVFGESNCGKTFLVLDVALHIVLGREWRERRTRQGAIVYIAAEGGCGLKERLDAFCLRHEMEARGPFYLIPAGVDLCNQQDDTTELVTEIQAIPDVALVVIDTLSRAMAGGNENSPDDMSAFIGNCDKIRELTGAHVLIIHHAGKDSTRGARGHSALRAAVDTEIEVTKDGGTITAEVKKQRDGRTGDKFCFILESVTIGQDEDGEPLTSCVLLPTAVPTGPRRKLSPQKRRALDILNYCLIDRGQTRHVKKDMSPVMSVTLDEYRQALTLANIATSDEPDNVRRSISRIIDGLNDARITVTFGDHIWLPDGADRTGRTEN
jgi:hypothetical protein